MGFFNKNEESSKTVKFTKKSKISTFNSCDNREETISPGKEYPYRVNSKGQQEMKYYDSFGCLFGLI